MIVSCSRLLFYYVQLTRACRNSVNSFQLHSNLINKCLLTLVRIARKMPAITHDNILFCLASYNFAWFCHFNTTTNFATFPSEQWVYDLICTQARGITNIANGAISIFDASFFSEHKKNVFQTIYIFGRNLGTSVSLLQSSQNRCKLETHSIEFKSKSYMYIKSEKNCLLSL